MFFSVLCLICLYARLLYVLCGHMLGKVSFVVSNCEFVTFTLVSWVRLGS